MPVGSVSPHDDCKTRKAAVTMSEQVQYLLYQTISKTTLAPL